MSTTYYSYNNQQHPLPKHSAILLLLFLLIHPSPPSSSSFFPLFVSADPSNSPPSPVSSSPGGALLGGVCSVAYLNPCSDAASCDPSVPIIGEAVCRCPEGFGGDGKKQSHGGTGCVNIDECSTGFHNCDLRTQICQDTAGSYECLCRPGHFLAPDNMTCLDIDECSLPHLNRCDERFTRCRNTAGSFECDCLDASMLKDAVTGICRDLNECDDLDGIMNPCQQTCHNQIGGVLCSCREGYTLMSDGRSCEDIDECTTGQHVCDPTGVVSVCENTQGSYNCICNKSEGYKNVDNVSCINFDECSEFPFICGGSESCCRDLPPPRKFACTMPIQTDRSSGGSGATSNILATTVSLLPRLSSSAQSGVVGGGGGPLSPLLLQNSSPLLFRSSSVGECPVGFRKGADLHRVRVKQNAKEAFRAAMSSARSARQEMGVETLTPSALAGTVAANTNSIAREVGGWYNELAQTPQTILSTATGGAGSFGGGASRQVTGLPAIPLEDAGALAAGAGGLGLLGLAGAALLGGAITKKKVGFGPADSKLYDRSGKSTKIAYGFKDAII
eukprot:GHVS01025160.1.p1 GENE.GHVS01025160.1~~GHVS01025160.1.p1  ORF type:complete len:559 (-),score=95.84 GHVS01025160.1:56-1732(-)